MGTPAKRSSTANVSRKRWGVPVGNFRKFKEPLQSRSPIRDGSLKLTRTGPKPILLARPGSVLEGVAKHVGENEINGHTGLLCIQE